MSFRENLPSEIDPDKKVIHNKKKKYYFFLFIILIAAVFFIADKYTSEFSKSDGKDSAILEDKKENSSLALAHSSVKELTTAGRPMAVVKDINNNLIVCDFSGHVVRMFDSQLSFLKQIGGDNKGEKQGEFNVPHAVDFDADENMYITDYGNKRIQKFSKNGEFLSILSVGRSLEGPATSYFDKDYNLYVSDFGSNSLVKMSKEGKFLGWIGAKEDGTLTDGWDINGTPAQSAKPGGFYKVHSAKFDRDGIMYVVDTGNNRIQRFSKEGKFLGWIGAKEDGTLTDGWENNGTALSTSIPGGFNSPIAMDFTDGGEFAVLEYGNPRVQRFSKEGKFIGWFGGVKDGGVTDGWKTEGLSREGPEPGAFKNAYDLKIYKNVMYVADTSNFRVQIIEFHN